RIDVVGHRQHGERADGEEMLVRHTVMRLGVRYGADDRGLTIVQLAIADPGIAADEGVAAVGGDHQARLDLAAVIESRRCPAIAEANIGDCRGRQMSEVGTSPEALQQAAANSAVLDDPAEGRLIPPLLNHGALLDGAALAGTAGLVDGTGHIY